MNRKEYMEELSKALMGVDPLTAADIREDYEEHFEQAIKAGRTEQEIIEELGSIDDFVEELKQFVTVKPAAAKEAAVLEEQTEAGQEALQTEQTEAGSVNFITVDSENPAPLKETATQSREKEDAGEQEKSRISYTGPGQEENGQGNFRRHGRANDNYDKYAGEKQKNYKNEYGRMAEDIVNSTVKAASAGIDQLASYLDKASGKFNEWFSSFEKSGESETDYNARQVKGYRVQKTDAEKKSEKYSESQSGYPYQDTEENQEWNEWDCEGTVTQEEEIRHISVDSRAADVRIYQSEDGNFHYIYENKGSEDSRRKFYLEKRVSQKTIHLIVNTRDNSQKKNHFSILKEIFGEENSITLHLYVPDWMSSLCISSMSGDIFVNHIRINAAQCKNMSGNIKISDAFVDKLMAESGSGNVTIEGGYFSYLLASSKSGNSNVRNMKTEKAAVHSLSGDAEVENAECNELAVSNKSGDIKVVRCTSQNISVENVGGDSVVEQLYSQRSKLSTISGDFTAVKIKTDNLLMSSISGDLELKDYKAGIFKASSVSGDMSLRGSSDEMNAGSSSGDLIVIQNGDIRAQLNSRSGDVNFHLKNDFNGFAAKVKTHGEISFRYHDLKLQDAACGEHRYGLEGSVLEITAASGDISITD